jgi:hypothetical protein
MGVEVPSPAWRALNERDVTLARERLEEETFGAAWAAGRALTLEEVVAEAVAEALAGVARRLTRTGPERRDPEGPPRGPRGPTNGPLFRRHTCREGGARPPR